MYHLRFVPDGVLAFLPGSFELRFHVQISLVNPKKI